MIDLINNIRAQMENLQLRTDLISRFINRIQELQNETSQITQEICEDDIEILKLSRLLIDKYLDSEDNNQIQIYGDDWRNENINFSLVRFWLDDLELNRFIDHKLYGIGGNAFFIIVSRRNFLTFIYDEINNVISHLRLPGETPQLTPEVPEVELMEFLIPQRRQTDMMNTLNQFKQFVERDGWKAYWKKGSLKNNLKSCPEEIGKSQFMAFLKGHGIQSKKPSNTFQEVQEGAGLSDIIHIDSLGKHAFELKIWHGLNYFDEGLIELNSYLNYENLDEGYYIIFDSRKKIKEDIGTPLTLDNGKIIHVLKIDIAPRPPTSTN